MQQTIPADMAELTTHAEQELAEVSERRESAPDIEEIRKRMPQANGDQDAW